MSFASPMSNSFRQMTCCVYGQRDQRKKWPQELIAVNLIVYLVAMDD
jgi:uncharacterized membrane protein YkvA (DUF1232 family)